MGSGSGGEMKNTSVLNLVLDVYVNSCVTLHVCVCVTKYMCVCICILFSIVSTIYRVANIVTSSSSIT